MIRCEDYIPVSGEPDQITSSPRSCLSGNSDNVALVALMTSLFPITMPDGERTGISLE